MRKCINWRPFSQKAVQCQTCHHYCRIAEGQVGLCGVRQNRGGSLYLLAYGQAVAVNIDPIEKKPLFHFLPSSQAFSFGTLGCNFRCANCQNFDISQMFEHKRAVRDYAALAWGEKLSPRQIVKAARTSHCASIAYTYNEPTVFLEYALDTMKLARAAGLYNIWVSNGFMSDETLALIIPYLDAINVDIKSFDDKFYQQNCGAHLTPVLKNCERLLEAGVWLEITTLVIPTLSDDEKMLRRLALFIKNNLGDFVPWHVSAFAGAISWRLKHLPDTSLNTIKRVYQIGREVGLKYVYAGNVWASRLESTFCPSCAATVIERTGYRIRRYDKLGQCPSCGYKIAGIFTAPSTQPRQINHRHMSGAGRRTAPKETDSQGVS